MDTSTSPLTLTDKAAVEVRSLIEQDDSLQGEEFVALRVAVTGGGCSGFQYALGFDTERHDDDEVIEHEGVTVLIDTVSAGYLQSSIVDYEDGLNGSGFDVKNPKSTGSCGCGQSFSC